MKIKLNFSYKLRDQKWLLCGMHFLFIIFVALLANAVFFAPIGMMFFDFVYYMLFGMGYNDEEISWDSFFTSRANKIHQVFLS